MPLPAGEADQIVRPHQPAEPVPRTALAKPQQSPVRQGRAELHFRGHHPDMMTAGDKMACAIQPCAQRCHAITGFQWVLRTDKPPDLVKAKLSACHVGKMEVAFMGWVERSPEQTDSQASAILEQARNAVPAKMIRFSRHEAGHCP